MIEEKWDALLGVMTRDAIFAEAEATGANWVDLPSPEMKAAARELALAVLEEAGTRVTGAKRTSFDGIRERISKLGM